MPKHPINRGEGIQIVKCNRMKRAFEKELSVKISCQLCAYNQSYAGLSTISTVFFGRGFPQRFPAKLRKTERNSEEFSKPLQRREG